MKSLERKIIDVLLGIDKCETEDPNGWWSTPVGAIFGEARLKDLKIVLKEEVKELIDHHVREALKSAAKNAVIKKHQITKMDGKIVLETKVVHEGVKVEGWLDKTFWNIDEDSILNSYKKK